jgi:hypothetical protein
MSAFERFSRKKVYFAALHHRHVHHLLVLACVLACVCVMTSLERREKSSAAANQTHKNARQIQQERQRRVNFRA